MAQGAPTGGCAACSSPPATIPYAMLCCSMLAGTALDALLAGSPAAWCPGQQESQV
jgi:hypothetical protein